MPTTIDADVETITQRSARATRQLCNALGLGSLQPKDLTLLTIALAEAGTEEARTNGHFANRVRTTFDSLKAHNAKPVNGASKAVSNKKAGNSQTDVFASLTPIGPVDLSRLRPHGAIDPYALYTGYGEAQAKRVLNSLTRDDLKQTAAIVEQRNPGTKPTNRGQIASLLAYITKYVN